MAMNNHTLHLKYFREGTPGLGILLRFYRKYADVLTEIQCTALDDLVNEVFLSLSKTDFKTVRREEHYVLRAIKLHCWSLLDKALRSKSRSQRGVEHGAKDGHANTILETSSLHNDTVATELEGMELLTRITLFKGCVSPGEVHLLNLLIDGTGRSEIASTLGLKLNTLDTHIRRLRLKLSEYLRSLGYTYAALERFQQKTGNGTAG